MSVRDLQTLQAWAELQEKDPENPLGERRLWRSIAREVRAYQGGVRPAVPGGAPPCPVCRESGGRHRSLASGRFVSEHDAAEGLLW